MKRVSLIVLTLCLISTIASADVDISELSLEELISLRNQIDTMIQFNLGSGLPVQGRYIAGVDIKEGYYLLTYKETKMSYSKISVYNTLEDAENRVKAEKRKQDVVLFDLGSTIVHLLDGNVLDVTNDTSILTAIADPEWKP